MSQGTPAAQLDEGVPGISLREVSKRYGSQDALLPVSLEIRDGEFFCLLGPSGCGKTTTLNLIGGFVAPTQGTIWIGGHRTSGTSTRCSSRTRCSRT